MIETKITFLDNEEINRESHDILFPVTLFGLFSIKNHIYLKRFKKFNHDVHKELINPKFL